MFKMQRVDAGRKALVSGLLGAEREVVGPKRLPPWANVRHFEHVVLNDGEQAYVFDDTGGAKEIIGPKAVDVHPDGEYRESTLVRIAAHEAVVVIRKDGRREILRGTEKPELWLTPFERLHQFCLTGGGEEKEPGKLRFTHLRLQDTQAYMTIVVRTEDNAVIVLKLMIYFGVNDPEKFLNKSEDPFGAFFNRIITAVTTKVVGVKFDEFKEKAAAMIQKLDVFTEEGEANRGYFAQYGIDLQQVCVREWQPADRNVQAVLERAAVVNTQKSLAVAEHDLAMAKIGHEQKQLEEEKKLDELRDAAAAVEGTREGLKQTALFAELKAKLGGDEAALAVMKLLIATKAQELRLGAELLQ